MYDLKHTYGHRLRVAGVGFEDRKVLLGHKSDHVTTHYSAPEIGALIEASDDVCDLGSSKKSRTVDSSGSAKDRKYLIGVRYRLSRAQELRHCHKSLPHQNVTAIGPS